MILSDGITYLGAHTAVEHCRLTVDCNKMLHIVYSDRDLKERHRDKRLR